MDEIGKIEEYLRSRKVSGVMAVRIRKLASSFATLDAFFSAKRTDIERMYGRITPNCKKGIGGHFWQVYNMALDFYKGNSDVSSVPVVADKPCETKSFDAGMAKMHTYEELKSIVDMMEFCGIKSINFLEIAGFLENVRFRQDCGSKNDQERGDGSESPER